MEVTTMLSKNKMRKQRRYSKSVNSYYEFVVRLFLAGREADLYREINAVLGEKKYNMGELIKYAEIHYKGIAADLESEIIMIQKLLTRRVRYCGIN